ncbi:DUF4180 domain-containing protein [Paenibacillus oenotherae]|uniref:DUF4180 domain-containing protein n=1 Tax=Paenibacillus oenotherae TaxID=1435645 RepID=A0ABS7D2A5_9BACL|nr:DUF4180 domain-containing protein [Paenibacillus oenotherae]MBW7474052.1 DUF4180 domain-containing protein [Paenibacillus oenotherae]
MSINFAILGILSCQSVTGYDLKKIIQESPFMHWSGNNNQIYKALLQLHDEGFVTNVVQHQESSPSKKIYTITAEGMAELTKWIVSAPEPPEFKRTFLIQLAWGDVLSTDQLNALLMSYENELRLQILLHEEKKRRGTLSPERTAREAYIWNEIHDHVISTYNYECSWVQKLRRELCPLTEEETKMQVQVIEKNEAKYIQYASAETPIRSEQDALDLIAACFENDAYLIMLHAEALSDDFLKLSTGLAGQVLQKLVNYRIKTAAVITDELRIKGRFKELLAESNKRNDFRVFGSIVEAEDWLLGG